MKKTIVLFMALSMISIAKADNYERIISTSGSYSEIIALLGAEEHLIGVDTTSLVPRAIMENITKIGYRRNLSAEGILSMEADIILLAPDSGPPAVINQLMQAKANLLNLSDEKTPQGVIENVLYLANALDLNEQGRQLVDEINERMERVRKNTANYPKLPRIAFVMNVGDGRLIGLGNKSAGDSMVDVLGGINVFKSDFDHTKAISLESLLAKDADIILMAQRESTADESQIIKVSEDATLLELSKVSRSNCHYDVDITQSLGWGPSFAHAAEEITQAINHCLTK